MKSKRELLDLQFIETRHLLVELAAFLDRVDRHPGEPDFRIDAFRKALPILLENRPDRARAVLDSLSDHSTTLPLSAPFQGAHGAPPTDH